MIATISLLPTPTNRLASAIREAYERAKRGGEEWLEGSIALAANLFAARATFPSKNAFRLWLKDSGLDYFNRTDRAALIAMGSDSATMREVLKASKSTSYQLIYKASKERFHIDMKSSQPAELARKRRKKRSVVAKKPEQKRASLEMRLTIRREKLGPEIVRRITKTSLDGVKEMAALCELINASPQRAESLIERAEKGGIVSAENELLTFKKEGERPTLEKAIELFLHSRLMPVWLRLAREDQDALLRYMADHRS